MSHVSMILTALMMMAMVVFFAPNIFALNRGHILRNIALWLAIFIALALDLPEFRPRQPTSVIPIARLDGGHASSRRK